MHIDLRNPQRQPLFRVSVDLAHPPAVVRPPGSSNGHAPAVHLNWDQAFDDEQHLRHCPVCDCEQLFVRRRFPQITAFAAILLAAVVAMLLYGFGHVAWAAAVFAVVLIIDVLALLLPHRELVCYRCHSAFRGIAIPRQQPGWERVLDEQYARGEGVTG